MADTPLRQLYVEAGAGASLLRGPEAWLEAGAKLRPNLGVYAGGYVTRQDAGVGVGLRWTADW